MARTQSENYDEIRKNILINAAILFSKKGYATTTIGDLAEACKSSRGALYHYFESKEDILFHILHKHVTDMVSLIEDVVSPDLSPEDLFRSIVTVMVSCNAHSQAEQIVLLNDLEQLSEEQQVKIIAKQKRIVNIMAQALAKLDAQKRLTPQNKRSYTMMLLGMVNYTFTWYDPNGPLSPKDYADITADTFLRGFITA